MTLIVVNFDINLFSAWETNLAPSHAVVPAADVAYWRLAGAEQVGEVERLAVCDKGAAEGVAGLQARPL